MKKSTYLLLLICFAYNVNAQIVIPVKWSCAAKKTNRNEAIILIKATIDDGWHIYSINQKDGGPVKTTISFLPSKEYVLAGKLTEPKPVKKFDQSFGINVKYFEKEVFFIQRIKLSAGQTTVKGNINFMACNDQKCLPPDDKPFEIPVK